MLVDDLEGAAQQLACFAVDLANGVFQRVHGVGQVQGLSIQELLAFAGTGQFFQSGQVHSTQSGNLAMQAVDLALQPRQSDVVGQDGGRHGFEVSLGVCEQLCVLLQSQTRGLLFELEIGDALAQRL